MDNIHRVLNNLGITKVSVESNHQNHFHVYLRPLDALPIGGWGSLPLSTNETAQQSVVGDVAPDVSNLQEYLENNVMLPIGPVLPPPEQAITISQAIAPSGQIASPEKTLTFCTYAESGDDDAGGNANNTFGVIRREVAEYFGFNHRILTVVDVMQFESSLIAGPKHGTVERVGAPGNNAWEIKPTKDYVGADRAVFLIEARGRQLKVVMEFRVMDFIPQPPKDEGMPPCRERSSTGKPVTIGFAPLGQGTLASAKPSRFSITLSPDAAGHKWFVDLTPDKNEEFLPTSNPNEWVARPGSAAEGKMDLLTVLLHEYGHVLGLDHSHDAHDFMATTLQPGVRRTLSVDQQQELMALAGYFPVPDSPSQPYGPTDPGSPLPFTRTSANRFGRMRPNFGQGKTEFDTVANPKLENPAFTDGTAWATEGDVAFGDGTATLKETSATQTRLNQVFVVGEHDRFLSFTLAGLGLGDQAADPDDAFEVALIDASSGAALLGGTGLSKSDAFLNLQANGNERKASAVSRLQNADGSRTYLVDLAGIAAGTVVNLSFDLIGFGKGFEVTNSQITVRDLRIGVPQTADDSASGSEDSSLAIDALANDLNALQPGFVPVVVNSPAHGSVAVEADGSFTYVPHADWSGEDEFTTGSVTAWSIPTSPPSTSRSPR